MENEKKQPTIPTEVRFNYIKSNSFRVVHCDGVIGAPTPQANITASFFSERYPIPQQTAQKLEATGNLGSEITEHRVQREGIVREVEVELVMSVEVARSIAAWLVKNAELIEKNLISAATAKEAANK